MYPMNAIIKYFKFYPFNAIIKYLKIYSINDIIVSNFTLSLFMQSLNIYVFTLLIN